MHHPEFPSPAPVASSLQRLNCNLNILSQLNHENTLEQYTELLPPEIRETITQTYQSIKYGFPNHNERMACPNSPMASKRQLFFQSTPCPTTESQRYQTHGTLLKVIKAYELCIRCGNATKPTSLTYTKDVPPSNGKNCPPKKNAHYSNSLL